MRSTFLAAALVSLTTVTANVLPITRTGKFLYDSTGARFFIKGVAYQRPGLIAPTTAANNANGGFPEPSDYTDPLADITACNRDIPNLVALGINTVRVYSLNPYADHSACFNALNTAGIYVIADLSLPLNGSINRAAPSWDVGILDQYLTTLNNILPYPNLLAVNIGNEVVTSTANSNTGPYLRAAVRDIKAFLRKANSKALVGYSSADGITWRSELAAYLTCASEATSIDLYGLNNYEFCGADATYANSGYQALTTAFANFPVVAYFSEFGCITAARTWSDVPLIYSAPMTNVWSGAVAFEYFNDALGYGLTAATTSNDGAITTNAQFTLLAAAYKAAIPPTSTNAGVAASTYAACVAPGANLIASATLPPTPSDAICNCLATTAFSCLVKPGTSPATIGALTDYACSLYASVGGSCDPIAGNGTTGVYGSISSCDAAEKLEFVATMYYEQQGMNPQACSFGGNMSISARAPTSAAAVNSSIASCISSNGAASTFTPSLSGGSATAGTGAASASGTGSTTTAAKSESSKIMLGVGGVLGAVLAVAVLVV